MPLYNTAYVCWDLDERKVDGGFLDICGLEPRTAFTLMRCKLPLSRVAALNKAIGHVETGRTRERGVLVRSNTDSLGCIGSVNSGIVTPPFFASHWKWNS